MKQDMVDHPTLADRVRARTRPAGWPVMHQTWGKLLFIHWPIDFDQLRCNIPPALNIDTHDGQAWVGITPFTMWNVRPVMCPPIPYLSSADELNVRTYVHYRSEPGIWFFSLDIDHPIVVPLARAFYHLPYFKARIDFRQKGQTIDYRLRRRKQAAFDASWTFAGRLPETKPGSLEYFLTERYVLFSERGGQLFRARIHHEPWPLRAAALHHLRSTMLEVNGLQAQPQAPLVHYAERLSVDVWPTQSADN